MKLKVKSIIIHFIVITAESFGLDGVVECSSKTGENVKETFTGLTKIMVNRILINKPKIQSIRV